MAEFVDGQLFERSIETTHGVIELLAEVVVEGSRLELRDIAVYPRTADRLEVEPAVLLGWARSLATEARDEGFDELRITGTRLSGANRGRRVDVVIRLEREQR